MIDIFFLPRVGGGGRTKNVIQKQQQIGVKRCKITASPHNDISFIYHACEVYQDN